MFFIVVFAVLVLALIGAGSVVGSGLAGLAALVLVPLVAFKLMFLFMVIAGFAGRRFRYREGDRPMVRRSRDWPGWSRPRREPEAPSAGEQFEEWHRMAHARDEVDGWVSDLGIPEQE